MNTTSTGNDKPSLQALFEDFSHPNPNIYKQACFDMIRYWPQISMSMLISNLEEKDIILRRKSIIALGYFGDSALDPLVTFFFDKNDSTVRISCLKVLVKIAALEKYHSLPMQLNKIINLCLNDDDPEVILITVCLLRQLGKLGLPFLIRASRDKNILLAKASVTAIGEINDVLARNCLRELLEEECIDELIRESVEYALVTQN